MTDAVLALNAGSSSVKFALAEIAQDDTPKRLATGQITALDGSPRFTARDARGIAIADEAWGDSGPHGFDILLEHLLRWIDGHVGPDRLAAAGHRVVQGGAAFRAPVQVTPEILDALDALAPLAPLHQKHSLAPIRMLGVLRPDLPQYACFDTGFHCTLPPVAFRFALPRAFEAAGIRRYGFHGLSYEHVARVLVDIAPALARGRVVVAHLGNGASLCALQNGASVDTTMGLTALDGLVMGTRCGAIDPGVLLYMLQEEKRTPDEIAHILYNSSGLLGVSGRTSDMQELLESSETGAREAIELFVYRIAREVGAMVASLGGLDGLVFTGGIGENAPVIRAAVCARLRFLGVALDDEANTRGDLEISAPSSTVNIRIVAADEEGMIIRHVLEARVGAG